MKKYLFVSIDTEEDIWGGYKTKNPSVENIKSIPLVQQIFEKYSAIPTYLINFPVASDAYSVNYFNELFSKGKCDIGAHCHPWNNPPFYKNGDLVSNSFLCNLTNKIIFEKINVLCGIFEKNFNHRPIVFRAGRWGVGDNVLKAIYEMGFDIDSSITPFTGWEEYHGPKFYLNDNEARYIDKIAYNRHNFLGEDIYRGVLEVPPTINFIQNRKKMCSLVRKKLQNKYIKPLLIEKILDRLGILSYRVLSPEITSLEDMIKLSAVEMKRGGEFLNMFFHSTSLLPGKSPFVKNKMELQEFLKKIDSYIHYMRSENYECVGMSEAKDVLQITKLATVKNSSKKSKELA